MVICTLGVFSVVSYIPETVVARPGEDITVYCVFNDHSMTSSSARWTLNEQPVHRSQYHSVNQWVRTTPSGLFISFYLLIFSLLLFT